MRSIAFGSFIPNICISVRSQVFNVLYDSPEDINGLLYPTHGFL
jgi:hypothetical protein